MTEWATTFDPTDRDSLPDLEDWELQHLLRAERAARAAERREVLAEMAAWHKEQEAAALERADHARKSGSLFVDRLYQRDADAHDKSARHAKALAAAADDPAGPLPVRVRTRQDEGHVALNVFVGPEHGGARAGYLIVRAEELPGLRAGWPGAAFIEETPRGTG